MESLELPEELEITEKTEVSRPRFSGLRPEWILGIIAAVSAVILVVVLMMLAQKIAELFDLVKTLFEFC